METEKVPASITDVAVRLPEWDEIWSTLALQAGFNTSVVIVGTALLGVAAGVVGTFALLRKRALMGDALSHATLPGIALTFLVTAWLGFEGRSLVILLPGAALSGILGVVTVQLIVRHTRLTEDTAIGVVLSVFFGAGIVLLSVIQSLDSGNQGGLATFIYGHTAGMLLGDAVTMGVAALVAIAAACAFLKEFSIVCFDDEFAGIQGWPVSVIDLIMMGLVVGVTVIGLHAVGLILVIAMLIIPAAAARFWTDRLWLLVLLAGVYGGLSGYLGSTASALLPRLPAGAVIVLAAGAIFLVSFLFAPTRGVVASIVRRVRLRLRVAEDHMLRAMQELGERASTSDPPGQAAVTAAEIARHRGWSASTLRSLTTWLRCRGLVERCDTGLALTERGRVEATRVTRNHRLWEQYLIAYADVAASHVDWSADQVEHVLSREIVAEIEAKLLASERAPSVPTVAPVCCGETNETLGGPGSAIDPVAPEDTRMP